MKPKELDYIALARPLHGEPGSRTSEAWGPKQLKQEYPSSKILVLDHHLCHAAAAYFPSPFEQACVLTLDETGDLKTGSLSLARGNAIEPLEDTYFPDSIGNVFSRATALAGFTAGSDEHKTAVAERLGKSGVRLCVPRDIRTGCRLGVVGGPELFPGKPQ